MSKYKVEQQISLDSKEFLKEAEKVKKANEEMGKSAEKASSNASEKVDKYTQKLNKLTETLERLKKEQAKYEEGSTQFNYYSKEIEKATNALDKHIGKTVELKKAIEEAKKAEETETTPRWLAYIDSIDAVIEALAFERKELKDSQEAYDWYTKELNKAIASREKWLNGWNNTQYENELHNLLNTFERLVKEQEKLKDVEGAWDYYENEIASVTDRVDKLQEKFFDLNETTNEYFDSMAVKENILNDVFKIDEYSLKIEQLKSRLEELKKEQTTWVQDSEGWKFYQDNITKTQEKIDELEGTYRGLNYTVNEYFESLQMKETILNDIFKIDEYALKVEQLKNKIAELRAQQSLYEPHQSGYEYYAKEIEEYTKRYEELVEIKKKDKEISQNVQTATKGMSLGFSEMSAVIMATYVALKKLYESLEEYAKIANESQRQTIALTVAIKNSGEGIEPTFRRLSKLIDEIDKKSLFSDKDITQAVAYMEAIQTLNDDALERAIKISADLATIMGDNLPNTARTLSRALTDPTNATFAFQRAGVKLSQETVQLAKDFMEEGNQAEAVNVMLKELEERYSGVAESVASLDTSVFEKIAKDTKDIKENLGEIFTNIANGALQPILEIIEKVEEFTSWLKSQSSSNTLLDKVRNGNITAEQIVMAYDPDTIKSAYANSYSVKLHNEEASFLNDPNHRGRTVNDMFNQDWWKQLNSLAQEEKELVDAMILLNQTNSSKSFDGKSSSKEAEVDRNSYAYKLSELKAEVDRAQFAYDNAQSDGEKRFEYNRLLGAKNALSNFETYGDANYKSNEDEQVKEERRLYNLLKDSQIQSIKDIESEYEKISEGMKSSDKHSLARELFEDLDISGLVGEAYREYLGAWGRIVKDITTSEEKELEEEEKKQEELTEEERRLSKLLWDSQIKAVKELESEYNIGSKEMNSADKQKFARELFEDLDISGLTGGAYREYLYAWSRIIEDIASSEEKELEEKQKKQEELTEEERRLYNLLKDSQIASIKDLESQYKNGSKDMQYWDKQTFAREIFADLDISGLVGEAYREYLEAWGRIVEDIDKSEEEWNAELKEARLKRMHEMNDALLKEREEGLKKMAEMEEFSLKKSLDSFIKNFGGEHEDPFIGYSESIDMMTGAMSSFYNTIRNGQGVLEAFKNAFFRVVDQIIEKLIALLAVEAISSIFGLDGSAIANASAYTMNAGKVMKTSLSSSLSNMYKSNMFSFAPAKYMKEGQGVQTVVFNIDGFVSSNEADFTRRVRETMNNGDFLVNIT